MVITTGSPIKKEMDSSATDDWKKDPYLYLAKAEGWYNTNDELVTNNILDKVCEIYAGRYASATKSMRIEDINTALGLTLDKTVAGGKLYKTADESKTAISAYQGFFGRYTYKNGDYAPENYLKAKYPSKYGSLINKKSGDPVEGTAFIYMYTDSSIVDQSSKLYEVLFKGTEESEIKKCYWLASPGVGIDSGIADFGRGGVYFGSVYSGGVFFISYGDWDAVGCAVRPVVYLQSGVTVDDLSISSSGTEENWTTTLPYSSSSEKLEYGQITE